MGPGSRLENLRKPFPKIGGWFRIIEEIAGTKNRVHQIAARNLEDPFDNLQARARQLFLPFLRERRKTAAKVPVGSV
jgi:hypothetical protein